ncbi:fimbrial protein [Pantoea sp. 1.19]|uniref:fimbrial protein n=1 Tax=Pantoea sp. 1.19 TaxID=1925589 RepID=UPI000948C9D7|nr:fimbrial protein [Pantoea sp. 1.19]
MKKINVVIAMVFSAAMGSASVFAADTTSGQIKFEGELVNTACGLSANSSPVSVNFYQVPVSALKNGARAASVQKNIELQYCDTTVAQSAVVTYNPTSQNSVDNSLAAFTSGTASGAGIGLLDSANQEVQWGQATAAVRLKDGTNAIPFVAFLRAEKTTTSSEGSDPVVSYSNVTAGSFQSTINFEIAYQ